MVVVLLMLIVELEVEMEMEALVQSRIVSFNVTGIDLQYVRNVVLGCLDDLLGSGMDSGKKS